MQEVDEYPFFGKLAVLEPRSPQAFMRLAAVYLSVRDMSAAEQNLRRALILDCLPSRGV